MESLQAPQRSGKRQRILVVVMENKEPCLTAGLSLVTPKKNVFVGQKSANDGTQTNTGIVTTGKGYSLNCPISVVPVSSIADVDTITGEYQHAFELESSPQLSLSFNVHRIDQRLSLAPNGHWSKMDYHLNKDGLVNEFLKDFARFTKNKIRNKKRYFETFDMVLANLLLANYESSQLLLSRQNGQHKNNNPLGIDNRTIALITDYLADRGLIDLHIGRRNKDDKNSSWCIPLPSLIAILDRYDAKIRLHEKTQLAVVRDGDKNAIPMYTDRNKRLALIRYGKPVAQHYETWLNHTATLDGRYLLPWLRRLFNWNMDLGGRFYGHYQQIPSADRKRILIDGERTVELDYKSVHIALLYALEGLPVTTDPYVIDGHADKRQTFKSIFLRLVNSDDLGSFKANITRSGNPKVQQEFKTYADKRQQYEYLRALGLKATEPSKPTSIKKGFIENIPTGATGDELLALVMEKHRPIAHHFGQKNIGLKLQKQDSELIALTLNKLVDIPCLPVHDSIRCRLSDMQLVINAMVDAFRELHGQNIVVTNDLVVSS
jgi:hypothetical protein